MGLLGLTASLGLLSQILFIGNHLRVYFDGLFIIFQLKLLSRRLLLFLFQVFLLDGDVIVCVLVHIVASRVLVMQLLVLMVVLDQQAL